MPQKYLIFIAIILAAFIVGSFIFAGLTRAPAPFLKENTNTSVSKVADKITAKNLSVVETVKSGACQATENSVVTKVIDGDTVVVEGGAHVRLLGIDADEKTYPCFDAAKTRLEQLVLGKTVKLEKDVTDVDQYGRCLRTIFVGSENIDVQLVKEGMAVARFYNPDVKYKSEIAAAEKEAMVNKSGCKWSSK